MLRCRDNPLLLTFVLTFIVLVFNFVFHNLIGSNEADVLVSAKAAIDPSWIDGDWYLGQYIGYRFLYNVIAGGLCLFLPIEIVSVIGRIVIACIFGIVLAFLFKELKLSPWWVFPVLLAYLRYDNLIAGEWIIASFETKSFAYCMALLALIMALRCNYVLMALFSGLALSFHVLVGFYALVTLVITIIGELLFSRNNRNILNEIELPKLEKILISIVCFFAAASFGSAFLFNNFLNSLPVEHARIASETYVIYRVPHHTLPYVWSYNFNIVKFINTYSLHNEASFGHVLDISLNVTGNYLDIVRFINSLEQSELVVDVHDLDLKAQDALNTKIDISVWGITY